MEDCMAAVLRQIYYLTRSLEGPFHVEPYTGMPLYNLF